MGREDWEKRESFAPSYYDILGVEKNASTQEMKKAFRQLANRHHPDKAGGDEIKFKEVAEAWEVLGDEQRRAAYDRWSPEPSYVSADAARRAAAEAEEMRRQNAEHQAATRAAAEAQARKTAEDLKRKETERLAKEAEARRVKQEAAGAAKNVQAGKKKSFWGSLFGLNAEEKKAEEREEKRREFEEDFNYFLKNIEIASERPLNLNIPEKDLLDDVRKSKLESLNSQERDIINRLSSPVPPVFYNFETSAFLNKIQEAIDVAKKKIFGRWVENSFVELLAKAVQNVNFDNAASITDARVLCKKEVSKLSEYIPLEERQSYFDRVDRELDGEFFRRAEDAAKKKASSTDSKKTSNSQEDAKVMFEKAFPLWSNRVQQMSFMNIDEHSGLMDVKGKAYNLSRSAEEMCKSFSQPERSTQLRRLVEILRETEVKIFNTWVEKWLAQLPQQMKQDIGNIFIIENTADPSMETLHRDYRNCVLERSDLLPDKEECRPYLDRIEKIWKESVALRVNLRVERQKKIDAAFERWEKSVGSIMITKIDTYDQVRQLHHFTSSYWNQIPAIVAMYPKNEQNTVRQQMEREFDDAGEARYKTWAEKNLQEAQKAFETCDGNEEKMALLFDQETFAMKDRDFLLRQKSDRQPYLDRLLKIFNEAMTKGFKEKFAYKTDSTSPETIAEFMRWYRDEWLKGLSKTMEMHIDLSSTSAEVYEVLLLLKNDLREKLELIPESERQQYIDHLDSEFLEMAVKKGKM